MSAKKYYTAHYDFWVTSNKANTVLGALGFALPKAFKDKKPNEELFVFALAKEEIIVGTVLIVYTAPPTDKILNEIIRHTHNILVDTADVYEEGEMTVIETPCNLFPFQFMMGELILGGYTH